MKKIFLLCMVFLLIAVVSNEIALDGSEVYNRTYKETKAIKPYVVVDEENAEKQVSKIDWGKIISKIPYDNYIQFDGLLYTPTSATLYKDEKSININVNDSRLIRLLNFYNNAICCEIYSYSQGTANDLYEKDQHASFRLELTFTPGMEDIGTNQNSYDKIIVVGGIFYCVRTDMPFEDHSYTAYLRIPLYDVGDLEWLSIFGFDDLD